MIIDSAIEMHERESERHVDCHSRRWWLGVLRR
jgi:hypothetical protein